MRTVLVAASTSTGSTFTRLCENFYKNRIEFPSFIFSGLTFFWRDLN